MIEMHWLYHPAVTRQICQRRRVYDGGLSALETLIGNVGFALNDFWLSSPLVYRFWVLWLLLYNIPPSILAGARGQLVCRDLYQAFAVGVGNEVTWWENFRLENGLQSVVVRVIVNLAVNLLLDDFVFMRFDDLVRNGCSRIS
jgi:hypothetical protein